MAMARLGSSLASLTSLPAASAGGGAGSPPCHPLGRPAGPTGHHSLTPLPPLLPSVPEPAPLWPAHWALPAAAPPVLGPVPPSLPAARSTGGQGTIWPPLHRCRNPHTATSLAARVTGGAGRGAAIGGAGRGEGRCGGWTARLCKTRPGG